MRRILLTVLAIFTLQFVANLTFGQSKWDQINPSPPAADYLDICFSSDNIAWACGEKGILIRSTDGGVQWKNWPFTSYADLAAVFFLDDENGWIGADYWTMFRTLDGGETWEKLQGIEWNTYALHFLDENIGWAGTWNSLHKSEDGGITWEIKLDTLGGPVQKILFTDEAQGYFYTNQFNIYRTTNGGEDWSVFDFVPTFPINDMYFTDSLTGWFPSDDGFLFRTINGGLNWEDVQLNTTNDLTNVHFYTAEEGVVTSKNVCFITHDGGDTWEEISHLTTYPDVTGFSASGNISKVTDGGEVVHSPDYGYSWDSYESLTFDDFFTLTANAAGRYFAAGEGGILVVSNDAGKSWELKNSGTTKDIYALRFTSENVGLGVGLGDLIRTEDGGETWEEGDNFTNYTMRSLHFLNENWGVAAGDNGFVFKTLDGGLNWENIHCGVYEQLNEVFFLDQNSGVVVGNNSTYIKTTDGGETWTTIDIGLLGHFESVYYKDSLNGWLCASLGLLSTVDGGETWVKVELDYSNWHHINAVRFPDEQHGWAVGKRGQVFQTTDGGASWGNSLRITDEHLLDVHFSTVETGVAVGEYGIMLRTDFGTYQTPGILIQLADTHYCTESYVEIQTEVIGDSLQYQWFRNGTVLSGEDTGLLIFDPVLPEQGGIYTFEIWNDAGMVESDPFMISVNPIAEVLASPADTTVAQNDTMVFSLAVTGALPIQYQWQKNGINIPGATHNIYPIYSCQPADSGIYRCIVSNTCTSDTTDEAKLIVMPASSIASSSETTLALFPNPVSEHCSLKLGHKIDYGIVSIYSLDGLKVQETHISGKGEIHLDMSLLTPGLYLMSVESDSGSLGLKFIKR